MLKEDPDVSFECSFILERSFERLRPGLVIFGEGRTINMTVVSDGASDTLSLQLISPVPEVQGPSSFKVPLATNVLTSNLQGLGDVLLITPDCRSCKRHFTV